MAYGLGRPVPAANHASPGAASDWRSLDPRSRLRLVERVLHSAGETIDRRPIAL